MNNDDNDDDRHRQTHTHTVDTFDDSIRILVSIQTKKKFQSNGFSFTHLLLSFTYNCLKLIDQLMNFFLEQKKTDKRFIFCKFYFFYSCKCVYMMCVLCVFASFLAISERVFCCCCIFFLQVDLVENDCCKKKNFCMKKGNKINEQQQQQSQNRMKFK